MVFDESQKGTAPETGRGAMHGCRLALRGLGWLAGERADCARRKMEIIYTFMDVYNRLTPIFPHCCGLFSFTPASTMARRTKEDALATRSALLDAAERVFLQQGVSRTSLADIAHAAGVTRGALYWHFKDKASLFNAMLDRVALPLTAELQEL